MIDTDALRSKILDLAIQGKLTEQLSTDGNAEELYQQIQAEKAQLIKEKKIKKEKPLPEITADEIPFDIPENWKWVRLGDICLQITDGTHKTPTYQKAGVPFLSVKNISSGCFDLSDIKYISEEEHAELIKRCNPEKNDILLCRIGTLGNAICIDIDLEFSIFVSLGLLKTTDRIISDYIVNVINSGYGDFWIKNNKAGGAMHTYKINLNSLALLPIPLAPVCEMERICKKKNDLLIHLETVHILQEKYNKDTEVFRSKLIEAAIQGKLTEQLPEDGTAEELYQAIQTEKAQLIKDKKIKKEKPLPEITADEIPFEVPDNWKWVRFGDIGSYRKGPFGSALTKSMFVPKDDNTVKVYEQQHAIRKDVNIGNYYISREYFENSMRSFEVISGDIIVSCAGTIGETFILPNDIEQGIINQALMRVKLFSGIDKHFFQYFFDAYLKRNAREESNGSAIKNIPPLDVMKKWFIPLPPLSEQKRIVAKINDVFGALDERDRL